MKMICSNCGETGGATNFCRTCGASLLATDVTAGSKFSGKIQTETSHYSPDSASEQSLSILRLMRKYWIALISGAGAIILLVGLVGIVTAEEWEKVDVPEQAETFHSESVLTGKYDVVDNHIAPCFIGEDWVACVNKYVVEFNASCAAVQLTAAGHKVCDSYAAMIAEMKAANGPGRYVSGLGSWGSLSLVPESVSKSVSNNDFKAAITHTATCYFGVLGECKD